MSEYFDFSQFAFNPDEYEERSFEPLPAGKYRVRIDNVEPKKSKNGNPYFAFELAVSGDNRKLWHNMVLTADKKMTNDKLGAFFKAFGITDFNLNNWAKWPGKIGGAKVRIRPADDNFEARAEVHYFLSPEETAKLPEWKEPENGMMAGLTEGMSVAPAGSVPPWEQF